MKLKRRKNKSGEVWFCEWWEDRSHRSQNIGPASGPGALSRKAASKLLSEFSAKLERQRQQQTVGRVTAFSTVADAAEKWLEANRPYWAANTYQAFKCQISRVVIPAIGDMLVSEVRSSDAQAILTAEARKKLSLSSVSQTKAVIGSLFAWIAAEVEDVRAFVLRLPRDLAPPKASEILTGAEIEYVMGLQGWTGTAMRLMLQCGLRLGEAMATRHGDIDACGLLTVARAVKPDGIGPTKTRRDRVVPVPPLLLAEIRAMGGAPDDLLFHKRNGSAYRSNEFGKLVDVQPRRLRTTFATLVSRDPAGVQAMLGHTSPRTTLEFYQKALPAQNRADVDALEEKLRRKAG